MAWTATKSALSKNNTNGNISVQLTFQNGADTVYQDLTGDDLTEASIADHCARKIESLTARDLAFAQLTTGPVTPAKASKDPKVVEYDSAYATLVKLDDLVARKIILNTDKEYTDALAAVKTAKAALDSAKG